MVRVILSALFLSALLSNTSPADLIDQQQTVATSEIVASFSTAVQSFQQTNDNISGAAVAIGVVPIDSVTIELYGNLSDVGNASLRLATGTVSGVPPGNFAEVDFGGPVAVAPNTTLYLSFLKTPLPSTPGNVGTFNGVGFGADNYLNGQAYVDGTPLPSNLNVDFAFQTFAAVPEPGATVILAASAVFVVCRRRRYATEVAIEAH